MSYVNRRECLSCGVVTTMSYRIEGHARSASEMWMEKMVWKCPMCQSEETDECLETKIVGKLVWYPWSSLSTEKLQKIVSIINE